MNAAGTRPRGRAVALLLAVMVLAVVSLFAAPATPAMAACSPATPQECLPIQGGSPLDCLDPPTPAMPDTGATSFFVSPPSAQLTENSSVLHL